jgi:hypothetical protein
MRKMVKVIVSSVLALGVTTGAIGASDAAITTARGYIAGKYGVELDGKQSGFVSSLAGGHPYEAVVVEGATTGPAVKKTRTQYEAISIQCGAAMSKGFYDWIKATLDHNYQRKNGAIITADYNYKEMTRLAFTGALITEIGFPALDAASKDAAKMTVTFAPLSTSVVKGSLQPTPIQEAEATQKRWLPSNFKVNIDGLDMSGVVKVDAITLKQKVVENPTGELREYKSEPANLEVPNLVITLDEARAASLVKWQNDFVIRGNAGDDKTKSGSIEYMSADMKTALFTLTFTKLGIFKLTHDKVEAGSENIRRVKAELYAASVKFDYSDAR